MVNVKVWYKGQPLECAICKGDHKVSDCDLKDTCLRCRKVGYFARNCPNPWRPNPTPAPDSSVLAPSQDRTPVEVAGAPPSPVSVSGLVDLRDNQLDESCSPRLMRVSRSLPMLSV